ncbi:50S ribosomal protein L21e [Candidatus Woesearchaeota archaeon]|nr:50S ribosomal protein L21e [Candidatus Woesearchaeota archaeon]
MVIKIGGMRRKTRTLLRKNIRNKGKISISRYFAEYKLGDRVLLMMEPAVQKGMYYPRYYGKVANVEGKRGDCYIVTIQDRSVQKTLTVHPVHIRHA